jgi:hypothetical protein
MAAHSYTLAMLDSFGSSNDKLPPALKLETDAFRSFLIAY